MTRPATRWRYLAPLLLLATFLALRAGLLTRHGLWADEVFSLAVATGHSLEHPAAAADPALGDFVEAPLPLSPAAYARYLERDRPPAGLGRVVRATQLSDTSPPLYYLLLSGWARLLGTSDAALRLFSLVWAVACFPLLWSLAGRVGGRAARVPTCLLFAAAPVSVFYATEGRMYSMVWFWALALYGLTLVLWRRGARPGPFALWVGVGALGLLTHYFFAFVLAPAVAWVFLHPGRLRRGWVLAGAALVGLCVLPWYAGLPESLAGWRVTAGWLNVRPGGYHPAVAVLYVPWSFFALRSDWAGRLWVECFNLAVFLALAAVVCRRHLAAFFTPRRRLLWFWLLGAWLGLPLFDLLRGTYVTAVPRYALAGMPAAFLLAGFGLGRLAPPTRAAFLVLVVLVCLVGVRRLYLNESRHAEPFRSIGELLTRDANPDDVVVVHSIPSGVAGVARYMAGAADGVGFAPWVGQLGGRRAPDDVRALAAGRRRVVLVKIHQVGEPAPEEDWLRENARLLRHDRYHGPEVLWFGPAAGETFPAPR